jgi:VCBS repeat-containing protein
MVSAADLENAPTSANPYIAALTGPYKYRPGYQITYVLQGNPGDTGTMGGALWAQYNAAEAYRLATEAWMAVANISIVGVNVAYDGTGSRADYTWVERIKQLGLGTLAQHTIPYPDVDGFGEYSNRPSTFTAALMVPGAVNFLTFLHEIGHGLGLMHPHENGHAFPGVGSADDTGDFGLNQSIYTVESYNRFFGGATSQNPWGFSKTPMAFDIAAIQNMYGANMTTATGDDVYFLPQANVSGTGWSCIWDAGGADTISGALTSACTIDLRAATLLNADGGGGWLSRGNGILGGFTIAHNVILENAIGSNGSDVISGNEAANWLQGGGGLDQLRGFDGDDDLDGGGGNDTLDGGIGIDTAIFSGNRSNYAITSLGNGSYSVRDLRGGTPDGTDTISAMEFASFANGTIAVAQLLGAADDAGNTSEDSAVAGNVLANDSTESGPKTVTAVNGVAVSVGQQIILASGAKLTLNADGSYNYDPNGKFNALSAAGSGAANTQATDSFGYTISDGSTATVTVTITGLASAGDVLGGDGANNDIIGTGGVDSFDLRQGGDDRARGVGGNDGFFMGAALTAADEIDGGAGPNDQVGLQGSYAGLVLGNSTFTGIESLVLLSGTDTRFGGPGNLSHSYNITWNDLAAADGLNFTVNFNGLKAGENTNFDGSAENDGSFTFFAGFGIDTLKGGSASDGFFFGDGARFTAADTIDGFSGGDDQLGLRGDYIVTFNSATIRNIDTIVLLSVNDTRFGGATGPGYHYDLTSHDGNVAAGGLLTVNGNGLAAVESMRFDGHNEIDGRFSLLGGAGADTLIGGAGNDRLFGNLGADDLTGNGGNDTFLYRVTGDSTLSMMDEIFGFDAGDVIDLALIDANSANGAGNDAFTLSGDGAFHNVAGELRTYQNGGRWFVEADTNGDSAADFIVAVGVANNHQLVAGDFIF